MLIIGESASKESSLYCFWKLFCNPDIHYFKINYLKDILKDSYLIFLPLKK